MEEEAAAWREDFAGVAMAQASSGLGVLVVWEAAVWRLAAVPRVVA